MNAKQAAVARYKIWRMYHELLADLGHVPSVPEIHGRVIELWGVAIPRDTINYYIHNLRTCDAYKAGQPDRVYRHRELLGKPDTVALMARNIR